MEHGCVNIRHGCSELLCSMAMDLFTEGPTCIHIPYHMWSYDVEGRVFEEQ